MGVTVLPNFGAQAGVDLSRLGAAISQLINPNQDIQRAFDALSATNPNAVAQIAAGLRRNPELQERLGGLLGEERLGAITAQQPTLAETVNTEIEDRFTALPGNEKEALINFMTTQNLTGMTPFELAKDEKYTEALKEVAPSLFQQGLERDITGQTAGQRSADDLLRNMSDIALNVIDSLPVEEQEKGALRSQVPAFFHDEDQRALFDQQLKLANARNADAFTLFNNRAEIDEADRFVRTTGVGNRGIWREFLFGGVDPNDERFSEVKRAFDAIAAENRVAGISKIGTTIRLAEDQVAQLAETDRKNSIPSQLTIINSQLAELGRFTNLPAGMRANYGKPPEEGNWFKRLITFQDEGIFYTDSEGTIYAPEDLDQFFVGTSPQQQQRTGATQGIQEELSTIAIQTLQGLATVDPSRMGEALAKLRSEDPATYAELKARGMIP